MPATASVCSWTGRPRHEQTKPQPRNKARPQAAWTPSPKFDLRLRKRSKQLGKHYGWAQDYGSRTTNKRRTRYTSADAKYTLTIMKSRNKRATIWRIGDENNETVEEETCYWNQNGPVPSEANGEEFTVELLRPVSYPCSEN